MNKQNMLVIIVGDKEEYKKLIQERMLDNGFCLFEGRCDLTKENTITLANSFDDLLRIEREIKGSDTVLFFVQVVIEYIKKNRNRKIQKITNIVNITKNHSTSIILKKEIKKPELYIEDQIKIFKQNLVLLKK